MKRVNAVVFWIVLLGLSSTMLAQPGFPTRLEIMVQKAERFRQLLSVEEQMTANQADYDVKYYSLDLTPDPVGERLYGSVEVVGEVLAATLDRVGVELLGWIADQFSVSLGFTGFFPDRPARV